MVLTGWILSGLLIVFILGASVAPKLLGLQAAIEPLTVVGWPIKYMLLIGCIELACMALYAFPRTALLGAVLMTGLLKRRAGRQSAGGQSTVQPYPVQHLFRRGHVGGAVAA